MSAFDAFLLIEGVPGESTSVVPPPPGWLRAAYGRRGLPRRATCFGPAGDRLAAALHTARREGWAGELRRDGSPIKGLPTPLLLLHNDGDVTALRLGLQRALAKTRKDVGSVFFTHGDGSVRSILVALLLPAVQKIREAGIRYPQATSTRQTSIVVEY